MNSPSSRQQGAALIVSLIMLILISLLAVASFRLGKSDLQIVGNMQQRKQALSAAQQTIEQVISSTQFTATPTNAVFNPCPTQNSACVDVNGDGVPDVNVSILVLCDAIQPILNSALNFSNPNDAGCLLGNGQATGVAGAANGNSMCSSSVWDVQATAKDQVTSAQYVVDQGVAVRVPAATLCP
jgi:type II secretory pathway pseudopilin PulG